MALHHAVSGELITLHTTDNAAEDAVSAALVKTSNLEVMRMVLAAGKSIAEHQVPGEITIQCLAGVVEIGAHEKVQQLHPGQMVYLAGSAPHALKAITNVVLLVTILLK